MSICQHSGFKLRPNAGPLAALYGATRVSALWNALYSAAYLGLSYLGLMLATSFLRELLAGSPSSQRRW